MKKFLCGLLCAMAMSVAAHAASEVENIVLTKDNSITINDVFTDDSVAPIIKQAKELDARVPSKDPIYLVISSPGGSISAGLELIDDLASLHRPVHTITVFSASMGFQTVQGLGQRLVLRNGTLMAHRAHMGMFGETPGQLDTRYQFWMKRIGRLDARTVERSNGKYSTASFAELIRDEFWCDGEDCVKAAVADRVVTASCDKSLEGIKKVSILQTMMQGHTVEITADYDLCPTNTNALKYLILVDGQPLFDNGSADLAKKIAASQEQQKAQALASSYDPMGLFSSSSSIDTRTTVQKLNLSKEEMFDIKQAVDKAIKNHESREVIKGY